MYKNKQCNHTYILLLKIRELQQHINKGTKLDLTTPKRELKRIDNQNIREKILGISYTEWVKKGLSKGTLAYMKKNAKESKPFTLNKHIMELLRVF